MLNTLLLFTLLIAESGLTFAPDFDLFSSGNAFDGLLINNISLLLHYYEKALHYKLPGQKFVGSVTVFCFVLAWFDIILILTPKFVHSLGRDTNV